MDLFFSHTPDDPDYDPLFDDEGYDWDEGWGDPSY